MLTLIRNGEVYAPERQGVSDVLILSDRIARVGTVDLESAERLGVGLELIDAEGCVVTPGFIDPHEHLLGGSGEEGFSTPTPKIMLGEIVRAGITTVVGCLDVDTTTMAGLLAKAKALKEEGLNAYIWSGGCSIPPTSILESVREDIMFVEEVIGAGEIAISDKRAIDPTLQELVRIVTDTHVGGSLSRKGGVTHFNVGPGNRRLELIRQLLDETEVEPSRFYLTHVERSEDLMQEAIELAGRGVFVDVDVANRDLAKWLRFYFEHGGDRRQITVSSDAGARSPSTVHAQLRSCVLEHGFRLDEVLPLVTSNTARALALRDKGQIDREMAADLVIMRNDSLEIVEVLSRGRRLVKHGRLAVERTRPSTPGGGWPGKPPGVSVRPQEYS